MAIRVIGQAHTVHENSVKDTFLLHNFQGGDAILPRMGRFGVTSISPHAHYRPVITIGQEAFHSVAKYTFK